MIKAPLKLILADQHEAFQVPVNRAEAVMSAIVNLRSHILGGLLSRSYDMPQYVYDVEDCKVIKIDELVSTAGGLQKLYDIAKVLKVRYSDIGFGWVESRMKQKSTEKAQKCKINMRVSTDRDIWAMYCGALKIKSEKNGK